jgi:hypothetical protein
MKLKKLPEDFTICKLSDLNALAKLNQESGFWFLGKTDEELSLVCETSAVPEHVIDREDDFKAFRICGVLDFSLIGILAKISCVMADSGIGIFAVSTYNTDYILVKKEQFEKALKRLQEAGYTIMEA